MTDEEFLPQARRRARELAAFAEQAVSAGVPVMRVTSEMCTEYTRQLFAVKMSPQARARAARNGGMGRSMKFREHLFKEA